MATHYSSSKQNLTSPQPVHHYSIQHNIKPIILLTLHLIPLLPNTPPPPGTYTITKITLTNRHGEPLTPTQNHTIHKHLKLKPSDTLTLPSTYLDDTSRQLLSHGYAINIDASITTPNTLTLHLTLLQTYPLIHSISFPQIPKKERTQLLQQLGLTTGKAWLPHASNALTYAIEQHLRNKGYANARAKINTQHNPHNNTINLTILTQHGPYHQLGTISFSPSNPKKTLTYAQQLPYCRQGKLHNHNQLHLKILHNLQHAQLRHLLQDLQHALINKPTTFNIHNVQQDAQQLQQHYRNQGYLDAIVSFSTHTHTLPSHNTVNVTFHINLGQPYTLSSIQWQGNTLVHHNELTSALTIQPGQPYLPTLLQLPPNNPNPIQKLYQEKKLPVDVNTHFTISKINPQQHLISLIGHIEEIPHPTIQHINIHTSGTINHTIISQILTAHQLSIGNTLTHTNLNACKRTLTNSGLFHPHTISLTTTTTNPQHVTLHAYLIEDTSLNYSLNINSNQLSIGIEEQNFDLLKLLTLQKPLGAGQKISAHLNLENTKIPNLALTFFSPWANILSQNIPWGIHYNQQYHLPSHTLNHQISLFAQIPYYTPYYQNYSSQLTFTHQHHSHSQLIQALTWKLSYQQDQTNNTLYPTSGTKINTAANFSYLIHSPPQYQPLQTELLAQFHYFLPIPNLPTTTLHYQATAACTIPQLLTHPIHQIILGYNNTTTQQHKSLLNPTLLPIRRDPKSLPNNSIPIGIAQTIELRYLLSQQPIIYGILFLDLGLTTNGIFPSIGLEIRILTPICIISLYIAYPYKKNPFGLRLLPLQ